jgi:hypothetical protein
MKRQISQERQVDAGCAAEVIVNGVRVLIGPVGEFEKRQREIGGNGHVKFGFTEGGNHDGTIASTARDLLPADIELDCKILLQRNPTSQLNADHRDIGPVEFGSQQRTSAQT